ncbi:MAG: hypothetical protein K0Q81_1158 [Paenibacillus sp.]|nr:hypothetical protein [Paenibacillus sp.]
MKKLRSPLMLIILLISSITATGCKDEMQSTQQAAEPGKPVVITTAKALRDYDILKSEDTIDNNPITRWARERLGIIQKNKWVLTDQNQAMATRVKLALSGNEELPDILFLSDKDIPDLLESLVKSGKFMDIGQAFEAYASPRVKEAFRHNPDVWRTVRLEGKAWGLPQISDDKVGSPILWIREDWLQRLRLSPPDTLEAFEKVLDAFSNGDPDGNGKKDTVGLALGGKNSLNGWMGDASLLFGAYGDQPYQWNRSQKDGKLIYGSIEPSMRPALERLHQWYASGYLDPDFGTHDEQEAVKLFMSGRAGIISGPGWMGGWPLSEMQQAGIAIKPIPFPQGPGGRVNKIGSQISYGAYFFRKDFAHMDLIFKYWDHVYGSLVEDPNSDFLYGYGEGYDHIRKDGEVIYDFPGGNSSTLGNFFLVGPGSVPTNVLHGESIEERVLRGSISTPYEKKSAAKSSRLFLEGMVVGNTQVKYSHPNQFVGPFTPTMSLKWPLLNKLEKDTFLKIVYGKQLPDDFDSSSSNGRSRAAMRLPGR